MRILKAANTKTRNLIRSPTGSTSHTLLQSRTTEPSEYFPRFLSACQDACIEDVFPTKLRHTCLVAISILHVKFIVMPQVATVYKSVATQRFSRFCYFEQRWTLLNSNSFHIGMNTKIWACISVTLRSCRDVCLNLQEPCVLYIGRA